MNDRAMMNDDTSGSSWLSDDELDLVLGGDGPSGQYQEASNPVTDLVWWAAKEFFLDLINNPKPPMPQGTPGTGAEGSSGNSGQGGSPGF